jgi:hypothetical protein
VRFNENGSVNGTFGVSGKTIIDMSGFDGVNALARATDSDLVAAGIREVSGN